MSATGNTLRNQFKEPEKKKGKKRGGSKSTLFTLKPNPRAVKITGLLFMSFAVFLLLSLVSFLFSWEVDQSLVNNLSWELVKEANPEMSQNWMGLMGAWVSHLLIYRSFGIAAFLLAPLSFATGAHLLFENRKMPLARLYFLTAITILFFSLLFGYVSNTIPALQPFNYIGGALGYALQLWLGGLLGSFGVAILLFIITLTFVVITFNPSFRLPSFARKPKDELLYDGFNDTPVVPLDPAGALDEDEEEDEEFDEEEFKLVVLPDKKPLTEANKAADLTGVDFKVNTAHKEDNTGFQKPLVEKDEVNRGSWYQYPSLSLLRDYESENAVVDVKELEERKNLIVETLENYKIKIDKIEATIGPTVTLYEIVPAAGVRISKIKSLEDDIALSLSALGIRIIAPMPGKGTIGIEVPNQHPEIVSLKEALNSSAFRNSTYDLPIVLGKTISNEVFVADLTRMPHLLMAGATGQGKSVGINTIIASILFKKHPEDVKFVLVDPKKVELSLFRNIENHFLPELPDGQEAIITDTKMVVNVLKSLCVEMDARYDRLKDAHVRNIKEYNKKIEKGQLNQEEHQKLPYIILVIDELADLMMTAGKEVEMPIARLAQLARAIGIHLIVATQRPSVNIITGIIKANFPARIAFRVTSRIDSRTILDAGGSEQLIGRGDMLFSTGNDMIRLQCPFIDTDEVEKLTQFIKDQPAPLPFRLDIITDEDEAGGGEMDDDLDSLFEDAARMIVRTQQGSTSMLQRRLKLGYNRAGRLMDQLERARVVGPNEGSKVREVLFQDETALEQFLTDMGYKG